MISLESQLINPKKKYYSDVSSEVMSMHGEILKELKVII
ncbi:hypothetical protein Rsl_721 [Rickettsia slovaca 13-B]|uniref:Uncharacterized protein n=1 Tax=Rickettsia slovaca (strain 13-B) TaxID=941638 RepID=A0ABM5MP60_RICS1|nr:hypothetical protein Rsl_721 [Rickettsia slovaca 13-B]